jgi:hypothetical protein
MYAKISNNEIIQYPANPRADHPNVGFPDNWGGGDMFGDFYAIVQSVAPPSVNIGWSYTESSPTFNGNNWIQTWTTSLLPNEQIKQQVSNKRYEVEVGGVTVSNNTYSTDRESQTKYVAVALDISQSNTETWTINWKTSDGQFVNLNANQMLTVISTVRQHVQACFDKEAEYFNLIDTSNSSVIESTDFSTGW